MSDTLPGAPPPPPPPITIGAPIIPPTEPIEIQQEKTRKVLALALVGILGVVLLAAVIAGLLPGKGNSRSTAMKDILPIILGPTVALVGAATGFYFGSNAGVPRPPD